MRVKIYINEEYKNSVDIKTEKGDNNFSIIRKLEAMQADNDILGIGLTGNADFSISSLTTRGGVTTNDIEKDDDNVQHRGSFVIGGSVGKDASKTGNLSIDGRDMGVKIKLVMYEPGWVLNTGKKGSNIFGRQYETFLKSIGSRNIKTGTLGIARIFKTKRAALDYIKKNLDTFKFCVSQHGYKWSLQPKCDESEDDYADELRSASIAKYTKLTAISKKLDSLLESINSTDMPEVQDPVPSEITSDTIKTEALSRLTNLKIVPTVIADFVKHDKIYMSEFGGIIYDLDDNAKDAVEQVKKDGLFPYHVIKSETEFGSCYSVLFVGNDTDAWNFERPNKDGIIDAYVYNATDPILSEIGSIGVISTNGGLQRVA